MYICIYTYIYTYTFSYMYAYMYVYIYTYMNIHMKIDLFARAGARRVELLEPRRHSRGDACLRFTIWKQLLHRNV